MPNNLTGQNISDPYQRLLQIQGGSLTDGTGSAVIVPSASYAHTASIEITKDSEDKIVSKKTLSIASEGIIKGSVQVPGDGNPIVLMVDHPTIGGYPKIATVILNDIAKLSNQSFGKEVCFKKVSIEMAEKLYNEALTSLEKNYG